MESLPGVLFANEGDKSGCLRRGTRVHFFPGSCAPVSIDLGPARPPTDATTFIPSWVHLWCMAIFLRSLALLGGFGFPGGVASAPRARPTSDRCVPSIDRPGPA